jgi:hypothetical protein
MSSDENALIQRQYMKDIAAIGNRRLNLSVDIAQMLAIIGNLQLALRHPGNTGQSARVTRAFIKDCKLALSEYQGICKLIDKGFDKKFDS